MAAELQAPVSARSASITTEYYSRPRAGVATLVWCTEQSRAIYGSHFRLDALRVNDGEVVNYGYDRDDLLTSAGPMSISRRADNGLLTGTTLG